MNLRFFNLIVVFLMLSIPSEAQSLWSLGDSLRISWYDLHKAKTLKSFFKTQRHDPSNFKFESGYDPSTQLFTIQSRLNRGSSAQHCLKRTQHVAPTNRLAVKRNWNDPTIHAQTGKDSNYSHPIIINSPVFARVFGGNKTEITPRR